MKLDINGHVVETDGLTSIKPNASGGTVVRSAGRPEVTIPDTTPADVEAAVRKAKRDRR